MEHDDIDQRLSRITTLWTLIQQAHMDAGEEKQEAQRRMIERYAGAIRRYLMGAFRNEDAAEEVFQDFACRFLQGKLQGADPNRGRFRWFLKGVLSNMVVDYIKQQRKQPMLMNENFQEPAIDAQTLKELDESFWRSWREDLLSRAWAELERLEAESKQPYFAVLRFRADNPKMRSPEMAVALSEQLKRELNAASVRQMLHRAREKFSDFLLQEVVESMENPTAELLEEELRDLGLLEYCKPSLERRSEG